MWAWRVDDDASSGLTSALVHTKNGVSSKKYNLIMEPVSNGPTSTPHNEASKERLQSLTCAASLSVLIMFVTSF